MHFSSVFHMQDCVARHLAGRKGVVLEVGSASKTAQFKEIFVGAGWSYVGADLGPGPNVDIVLQDPFLWDMPDGAYDAIISGQMLEHNEMFWLSFLEMARVLKVGGAMIHIAPSRGPQHRAPQDCWRYYPDGMAALAKWSGLDLVEATTDWTRKDLAWMEANKPYQLAETAVTGKFEKNNWGDTVGVFRKTSAKPALALDYMKKLIARLDRP